MADTVRDRIRGIQVQLRDGALTPDMARESLVELTALYGNVLDECREADHAYGKVLLGYLEAESKANRARIKAEATDEYQRVKTARDTKELVLEMVRSCKVYLRSLDEEMRLSR